MTDRQRREAGEERKDIQIDTDSQKSKKKQYNFRQIVQKAARKKPDTYLFFVEKTVRKA